LEKMQYNETSEEVLELAGTEMSEEGKLNIK
jgi:hypothetical protein